MRTDPSSAFTDEMPRVCCPIAADRYAFTNAFNPPVVWRRHVRTADRYTKAETKRAILSQLQDCSTGLVASLLVLADQICN